jgi:hypothetical protein
MLRVRRHHAVLMFCLSVPSLYQYDLPVGKIVIDTACLSQSQSERYSCYSSPPAIVLVHTAFIIDGSDLLRKSRRSTWNTIDVPSASTILSRTRRYSWTGTHHSCSESESWSSVVLHAPPCLLFNFKFRLTFMASCTAPEQAKESCP